MRKIILMFLCIFSVLLVASCNDEAPKTDNNISVTTPVDPNTKEEEKTPDNKTNGPSSNDNPVTEVVDKESRELSISIPEDRPLKVLQLADIHFGVEGKDWHNDKVERTKLYISYIIKP